MYRGQAIGLKTMGHSRSCRCHIVAANWCWGSAKSRNGVGHASDGRARWLVTLGRLAAWPRDSRLPLTNGKLPFFSTALCSGRWPARTLMVVAPTW